MFFCSGSRGLGVQVLGLGSHAACSLFSEMFSEMFSVMCSVDAG